LGKELAALEKDMKEKAQLEIKASSTFESKQENVKSEEKKLKDLRKSIESVRLIFQFDFVLIT